MGSFPISFPEFDFETPEQWFDTQNYKSDCDQKENCVPQGFSTNFSRK